MKELTYLGFLDEIVIFSDPNMKENEAILIGRSKAEVCLINIK